MTATNEATPISRDDFASLGINGLAYIKPMSSHDGKSSYAIHAADGTRLRLYADRKTAIAVLKKNGLIPMSLH